MGTKDRLADLRVKAQYTPDEENENSSVTIMIAGLKTNENLTVFENEVEQLKNLLNQIEDKINRIVKLYSTDVTNFKAKQNDKAMIDQLTDEIRRDASCIRNKLKEFDDNLEQLKKKGQTGAEFRIKKNQHSFILNTFIKLMTRYNEIQMEYRDKCKKKIQVELEITGKKVSHDELENMIETGELEIFTENYQSNNQKSIEAIDHLKKQKNELEKLESSIRGIHELFLHMAHLVENQGELVDRIESQVSNAREYAMDGVKQTEEALNYHQSLIKKKFCCYSVLIVLVLILVIYTIIEFKS